MLNPLCMDALALLQLHQDWGADEALDAVPRDRLTQAPQPAPPQPVVRNTPSAVPASGALARATALAAAAASLPELRQVLAGFSDCALQSTAIHLVFADGPAAALMIIGDIPGEDEDRSGRPFSGPGGQLLDRMLASIGLNRSTVRLATVIPWRPPGNRKPTEHERALCLPFLHRHIALAGPRRLLLLGTPTVASVIPAPPAALRRLRGRWQTVAINGLSAPVQALPTFSPEHLMTNPAAKRDAWADLLVLRSALEEDAQNGDSVTRT